MMDRVEAAKANGKIALRCDSPEEGLAGYVTFLPKPQDWDDSKGPWDEKMEAILWAFFGRQLSPESKVASTKEEVEAFESANPAWSKADRPQERRLGFVSYRRAFEGKSDVLYVPLHLWEMLPSSMRLIQA